MCGPYPFTVWTIDHGEGTLAGRFLLRCYTVSTAGVFPYRHSCVCNNVEEARDSVPRDCNHHAPRRPTDRETLIETWE